MKPENRALLLSIAVAFDKAFPGHDYAFVVVDANGKTAGGSSGESLEDVKALFQKALTRLNRNNVTETIKRGEH